MIENLTIEEFQRLLKGMSANEHAELLEWAKKEFPGLLAE